MKRLLLIIPALLVLALFGRLFLGVYVHDEFGGRHLFVKHRPIWKWKFNSPIGLTDIQFEELSPERQEEQLLWNEFVRDRGHSR